MRKLVLLAALALPLTAFAQDREPILLDIAQSHILPSYARLADTAQVLSETAKADCAPNSDALRAAYADAFDSWISVSHMRFGPSEVDDRAFSLAFWPDTKGFTPRALSRLIDDNDNAVQTAAEFAETSVAGRGFFALEQMLYDPAFADQGSAEYRCDLIRAIAADIAANATAIDTDWQTYAQSLTRTGENSRYRNDDEAMQEMFKALSTGLEFTADTRLGRPLGSFERPRPKRAEARRSARSLRHVELSLIALQDLALRLSADHPDVTEDFQAAFDRAIQRAQSLGDPNFAGVSTPEGRFRVEALQQTVSDIRRIANTQLGPALGIGAGFNSLDGD
ncbi:peptidase M75 [Ruegeria sp. ANG-S4]|uniref:imelysin family protein n=1 Tax=Ruegeria sp. ANG-S4 TaxID=1577904 RepID=UPI00057D31A0|nr:imelysin family protein [Ruegeria sp. ANG-S4]KIC41767.1 peptidase M75 [Ruegeria sp. ANG-S4]